MADEHEPGFPRDVDSDVDPALLAEVQHLLGDLDFLRPDVPRPEAGDPVPMPDAVWSRLTAVLAAEQDASGGSASLPARRARASRATRWVGGLAAASVAVLAVGIGVQSQSRGSGTLTAAAEGTALAAPAPEQARLLTDPAAISFAGIAPAHMLVDSDTEYRRSGLRSQVRSLLSRFDVRDAEQAQAVMAAPTVLDETDASVTDLMSSVENLRDCITKLTQDAEASALLVDRSTFEGQPARVIIAPEHQETEPSPELSRLEVWVVDQECDILVRAFSLHLIP